MPLEISEWKPEIAPQAIVMKQNGKILPAEDRARAVENCVTAGSWTSGRTDRMPPASRTTVPSLTKVER